MDTLARLTDIGRMSWTWIIASDRQYTPNLVRSLGPANKNRPFNATIHMLLPTTLVLDIPTKAKRATIGGDSNC